MIDAERLLEQLRGGASLGQLLATIALEEPPSDRELLLRRCALVRSFDRSLYDQVLASELSAGSFAEFVKGPGVEPLPDGQSFYVAEAARRRAFEAWNDDRPALSVFAARLVTYYESRQQPIDVFAQRILCDAGRAQQDLAALYREADERFDLPACSALLLLLRNRSELLEEGSPLRADLTRREPYLRSRTQFAEAYYRTVSYLHRTSLEEASEGFLADQSKWILHLYGKGGTGKTMFLRWLVARRLVKETAAGDRVPVALLDFDRLDLAAFARAPWLILPAIAEQLEPQLEKGVFASLLAETRSFAPLLGRSSRDRVSQTDRRRLAAEGRRVGTETEASFVSKLGTAQVVVVLDTLEEPLLHYKAAVRSVLDLFVRVRKACPGFRLVVAGRYNLADRNRLPATMKALEKDLVTASLGEFTRGESLDYLRTMRGIERSEATLEEVHEHTRGNPLEISLFAELLRGDVEGQLVTPAQIHAVYPITKFAYLLDRIIQRIPDNQEVVRWVLRYAVVPRTLSRRYFDEVLATRVPREVSGRRSVDTPNAFTGKLAPRYGTKTLWKHTRRQPSTDRVWKQLESYAASASWVTSSAEGLHLQPELTNPMRDLLQQQSEPIFRELHRRSIRYFEDRARREPDRWVEYIAEAIYHRFQLDGRKAVGYLRRQLARRRAQDPAIRERLAGVLLGSEFLDPDTREPRFHKRTGTIIDRRTAAEAAFDVCIAAIMQRLRVTWKHADADALDEKIADQQRTIELLSKGSGGATVAAHRRTLVAGAVAIYAGRTAQGGPLVRAALRRERRPDLRLLGELLIVLPLKLSDAEFQRRFRHARALAVSTRSTQFRASWVDYCWGLTELESSSFVAAARRLGNACRQMLKAHLHSPDIADCLRRAVQAHMETGDEHQARALLDPAMIAARTAGNRTLLLQCLVSSAQLSVRQFDVRRAERDIAQLVKRAGDEHRGIIAELEGDVAAALLRTHEVEAQYLAATEDYAGWSLRGQMNCYLKRARHYLEALEHGPTARTFLAETRRSTDPWSPVEHYVLGSRLAALTRTKPPAAPRETLRPAQAARARAAVLATGRPSRRETEAFLKALAAVASVGVRADVLRELSSVAVPTARIDRAAAARLRRLVPLSPRAAEYPVRALHLAAALRYFGDDQGAAKLLGQAWKRCRQPFLKERLLRALASVEGRTFRRLETAFPMTLAVHELRSIVLIEEAERRLAASNRDGARTLLRDVEKGIDALGTDTTWHIRYAELMGALTEPASSQEAADWYSRALTCAQRSQNRPAQERLESRPVQATPRRTAGEIPLRAPATYVRLDGTAAGIDVVTSSGSGSDRRRTVPVRGDGTQRLIAALRADSPLQSVDLLNGPRQAVVAAVRAILGADVTDGTGDVGVRSANRSLAAFPWELGLATDRTPVFLAPDRTAAFHRAPAEDTGAKETIVWMQSVLAALGHPVKVDGTLTPRTEQAIRAVVPAAALRGAPIMKAALREKLPDKGGRILIVRPAIEKARSLGRAHGLSGFDLRHHYLKATGTSEIAVEDYTIPKALEARINAFKPTTIHLVTSFIESRTTREICLDLGDWTQTRGSTVGAAPLTASYFKSFLERLPRDQPPPFVILEATLPADEYERARQVLLRNGFAAELLAVARTRGVLATGLFPEATLLGWYSELISLILSNPTAGQLHHLVWRHAVAEFPPALFTMDPDLPVLR